MELCNGRPDNCTGHIPQKARCYNFPDALEILHSRVRLLIDRDIREQAWFACHPCINTASLKFKTSELWGKVIPAMEHEATFIAL